MPDMLDWQARHRPDRRAFLFLERGEREVGSCTYAELECRARQIARAIFDKGLVGRRIVLAYPTCLEFIAALFGCFYAGAVAIPAPVDRHRRNASRLRAIMTDASAGAVFSLRSALVTDTGAAGDLAALATGDVPCIATDEIPREPDVPDLSSVNPDSLALLQYTSGSTGSPRGVMLTHRNIMANQQALAAVLESGADDIGVNWLPLYHDMGLIGGVLHTIFFGGFTALMPPLAFIQKPIRWLQAIDRYRATISMGPGFAYDLVSLRSRVDSRMNLDLSSWRAAICGGEPIRPRMLERFAAAFSPMKFSAKAFLPAYGLAEATLIATAAPAGTSLCAHSPASTQTRQSGAPREGFRPRLACCGPAVLGQRVAIVEAASRTPVPDGEAGEIWLRGPSVAVGYWNRQEQTRATFGATLAGQKSERWLRTGDIGFMSAAGLVITGRAKEIIVIRGANFDPLDLEIAACESDVALDSGGGAAFSLEHESGERLILLHEVARDTLKDIDVRRIADNVVEAINQYFGLRLHDLVLVRPRTLPRTTSGKIQRYACKEQYLTGQLAALDPIRHPALGKHRAHVHLDN